MATTNKQTKIASSQTKSVIVQQSPQQHVIRAVILKHEGTQVPIPISIESPTDWPSVIATLTVGLGSIMTSLIVGYLSHQNQKAQVQSSIATLRSIWIKDLRQLAGEFIGLAARIGRGLQSESNYLESQLGRQELSELFEVTSQIELMLDPKKRDTRSTANRMRVIVESLQHGKFDEANLLLNKFKDELSTILEKGWTDVKKDLRNPGKSLKSS